MKTNKWKFEEAFNFVRERRSIICPNNGFIDKLLEYEVALGLSSPEEIEDKRQKVKRLAWNFPI
jgi:hypothetical protein